MSLVFGKYAKIRRIAQGGMGEVYLARQTGVLDRFAILKSLRPDLGNESALVDQFLDEARVAATLNHPNIVAIYDVGEWLGVHYIAMEYIAGEDLSRLWYAAAKAGVGLPFQVSVRIIMDAALGLDHAHRAKDVRGQPLAIVHRDVSPQNIMVRVDGVTKLVDFGIAKAANKASRTQAGMVKGKLQYMSPEQVRGEPLDGRSDQFSLGVVLWEMCTGRRLFKADTEANTLQKILQAPIHKPSQHVPGFPPELEAVIMRMLERDPKRRFATVGDVATKLKEYLDRSAVSSGEVSVAAFVDQILGKELQARIADLTPMESGDGAALETSSAASSAPASRPSGSASWAASSAASSAARPASIDPIVAVAATRSTTKTPPRADVSARRDESETTTVVPPERRPAAREGLVTVADGPVGDTATQPPDDGLVGGLEALDFAPSAPSSASATPASAATAARTPAAIDPFAPAPTGAFSLGALPTAHTGAWQMGADFQALQAAARAAHGDAPAQDLAPTLPTSRASRPRRLAIAAAAVALVGGVTVVGGFLAPGAIRALQARSTPSPRTTAARAAIATDAPAALLALRATLEPLVRDGTDVDALVAAALLDAELRRVDEVAGALGRRGGQATSASPAPPSAIRDALNVHVGVSEWSRYAVAVSDLAAGGDEASLEPFVRSSDPVLADDAAATARAWRLTRALARATASELQRLADEPSTESMKRDGREAGAAALIAAVTAKDEPSRARAQQRLLERQRQAPSDPRLGPALRLLEPAAASATTTPAPAPPTTTGPTMATTTTVPSATTTASPPEAPTTTATAATPAAPPLAPTTTASPAAPAAPSPTASVGAATEAPPPETYETALAKGRKAQKAGRSKEAIKLLSLALGFKPGDPAATLAMSWALLDAGRHEAAAKGFRAVVTGNPSFVEAQFGLGEALRAQGKTTEAIAAFQRYLELAPTGQDAEIAKNAIRALE